MLTRRLPPVPRLARAALALTLLLVACAASTSDGSPPSPEPAVLPAFPGAFGFGAEARGGRGGRVLRVTTLAASGPGSLQAALDEQGPRTIIFDISGLIDAVIFLRHEEVTIAGQTSPGGIAVRGLMIQGDSVYEADGCPLPSVAPEDFIVRFLRIRDPLADGADGDSLRLLGIERPRAEVAIGDFSSTTNTCSSRSGRRSTLIPSTGPTGCGTRRTRNQRCSAMRCRSAMARCSDQCSGVRAYRR